MVETNPFLHQSQNCLGAQIASEHSRKIDPGLQTQHGWGGAFASPVSSGVGFVASDTCGTTAPMSVAKVAVSIDDRLLRRLDGLVAREVFRSRSEAIQKAVAEKLARMDRSRLARECAKLLPAEEQRLAEGGLRETRL
jgi:Arc/MetJ-type ribon-helix-helix transcriptional regulator